MDYKPFTSDYSDLLRTGATQSWTIPLDIRWTNSGAFGRPEGHYGFAELSPQSHGSRHGHLQSLEARGFEREKSNCVGPEV
jgi:hypothetical protein